MFNAVADRGQAALRVRLGGLVSVADLDRRAAALSCETWLDALPAGSTVLVDATTLEAVEPEACGVLLFLLQRALRIPACEVLVAVSGASRTMASPYARTLLRHPRLRVLSTVQEAEHYARSRRAA